MPLQPFSRTLRPPQTSCWARSCRWLRNARRSASGREGPRSTAIVRPCFGSIVAQLPLRAAGPIELFIRRRIFLLDNQLHQASNACRNNSVLDYFLFCVSRKSFALQHRLSVGRKCHHRGNTHTVDNFSVDAVAQLL
jgi:hypothetical protein